MAESQDQFSYISPVDQNLSNQISAPRLGPYLMLSTVNGNLEQAFKWYLWNARLSKSFLFPLQTAEVSVRNAIHNGFSSYLGGPNWIFNPPFTLNPNHQAALVTAIKRLKWKNPNPTSDDVVASLSFDFWSNLFRDDYEALWMAPNLVRTVFPHSPNGADRDRIKKLVRRVNDLRNRIAHHEPIHRESSQKLLESIEKLVGYVCPDTSRWMLNYSTVASVARSQPSKVSIFSGPPISSANIHPPLVLPITETLSSAIRQMKTAKPPVALMPDASRNPPYLLVTLADIASFIEDIASQQSNMVDLSQHTLQELMATCSSVLVAEIPIDASTGDATARFYPKGKKQTKPQALLVIDPGGALVGLIMKPMIKF